VKAPDPLHSHDQPVTDRCGRHRNFGLRFRRFRLRDGDRFRGRNSGPVQNELAEISRNFVASCFPSRDVYYFGEEVDIYEDGKIVDHEGAWLAGRHGAKPGMLMPEDGFLIGSRYFQEVVPDVALDRAEHIKSGFSVQVPAGRFDNCVEVKETTPLEPGDISTKVYCRGVGLVRDDDLELTAVYGNTH